MGVGTGAMWHGATVQSVECGPHSWFCFHMTCRLAVDVVSTAGLLGSAETCEQVLSYITRRTPDAEMLFIAYDGFAHQRMPSGPMHWQPSVSEFKEQ